MKKELPLSVPEGGDRKFTVGMLKGRTFLEITLQDKLQYFSIRGAKQLTTEQSEYREWVEKHFTPFNDRSSNGGKTSLILKPAGERSSGGLVACAHTDVHHKGSSARYVRSTCNSCGKTWQEERNVPTTVPGQCMHRRTDHRGSNKQIRKTFCLDCGTYIDSVTQGLAKSILEDSNAVQISNEEKWLLDRVGEHNTIARDQIVAAAEMMLVEARQLEAGNYTLVSIGNMFIDCADRVISDHVASVPVSARCGYGTVGYCRECSHDVRGAERSFGSNDAPGQVSHLLASS